MLKRFSITLLLLASALQMARAAEPVPPVIIGLKGKIVEVQWGETFKRHDRQEAAKAKSKGKSDDWGSWVEFSTTWIHTAEVVDDKAVGAATSPQRSSHGLNDEVSNATASVNDQILTWKHMRVG